MHFREPLGMRFLAILLLTVSSALADMDKVIAHRGASFDAPENTTASIALAVKKGAKIIEFDVRQTSDGGLYLFHDEDLERLCAQKGVFSQLTGGQAAKLDVGSWFTKGQFPDETPPTLAEAIQQCLKGGATPLIEHKTGDAAAYAKVLTDLDVVDSVVVQSLKWDFLLDIKKLLPSLKIGALGSKILADRQQELTSLQPDWVGWSDRDITRTDIDWLKKQKYLVAIWTVNDPRRARQLVDWGADKIITDRPLYLSREAGL